MWNNLRNFTFKSCQFCIYLLHDDLTFNTITWIFDKFYVIISDVTSKLSWNRETFVLKRWKIHFFFCAKLRSIWYSSGLIFLKIDTQVVFIMSDILSDFENVQIKTSANIADNSNFCSLRRFFNAKVSFLIKLEKLLIS